MLFIAECELMIKDVFDLVLKSTHEIVIISKKSNVPAVQCKLQEFLISGDFSTKHSFDSRSNVFVYRRFTLHCKCCCCCFFQIELVHGTVVVCTYVPTMAVS